tara:strand:- start:848 stop:2122 length:1275 start_codon:yes stop_codon:yes gene_type:complete
MDKKDIIKYLLGTLAGGVAGGGLSGYLSSQNKITGESKKERRKRILRNALIGTGLGGVAGAGLTAGAGLLQDALDAPTGDSPDLGQPTGGGFGDQVSTRFGGSNIFDDSQDTFGDEVIDKGVGGAFALLGQSSKSTKEFIDSLRGMRADQLRGAIDSVAPTRGVTAWKQLTQSQKLNKILNDPKLLNHFKQNLTPGGVSAIPGTLGTLKQPGIVDKALNRYRQYNAFLAENNIVNPNDKAPNRWQSSGINSNTIAAKLGIGGKQKKLFDAVRFLLPERYKQVQSQSVSGLRPKGGIKSLIPSTLMGLGGHYGSRTVRRGADLLSALENPNMSDLGRARNYAIIDRLNQIAQKSVQGRKVNWEDLVAARDGLPEQVPNEFRNISNNLLQTFTTDSAAKDREGVQHLIDRYTGGDNPIIPDFNTFQ